MPRPSIRASVGRAAAQARRLLGEPFGRGRGPFQLVHVAHHRAGTLWFTQVLSHVARFYGLSFESGSFRSAKPTADVVVLWDSPSMFEPDRPWKGSHVIRDPRDMVVSGYHYHRWSEEPWLHVPRDSLGGQTYQEALNAFDEADGLSLEIREFASWSREMADWDYGRPETLELRYEDIMANEGEEFRRLFEHYGFSERATRVGLEVAANHSLTRLGTREGSHMRSGKPGQWQDTFTEQHVALFKHLTGNLVVRLGYERDENW